jgi:hypothetical protein
MFSEEGREEGRKSRRVRFLHHLVFTDFVILASNSTKKISRTIKPEYEENIVIGLGTTVGRQTASIVPIKKGHFPPSPQLFMVLGKKGMLR